MREYLLNTWIYLTLCESLNKLFFYRRKDESAATTAVSTVWLGFHKREEHPTTDRTRFINFHFGVFYFAGAVLKFDDHIFPLLISNPNAHIDVPQGYLASN